MYKGKRQTVSICVLYYSIINSDKKVNGQFHINSSITNVKWYLSKRWQALTLSKFAIASLTEINKACMVRHLLVRRARHLNYSHSYSSILKNGQNWLNLILVNILYHAQQYISCHGPSQQFKTTKFRYEIRYIWSLINIHMHYSINSPANIYRVYYTALIQTALIKTRFAWSILNVENSPEMHLEGFFRNSQSESSLLLQKCRSFISKNSTDLFGNVNSLLYPALSTWRQDGMKVEFLQKI